MTTMTAYYYKRCVCCPCPSIVTRSPKPVTADFAIHNRGAQLNELGSGKLFEFTTIRKGKKSSLLLSRQGAVEDIIVSRQRACQCGSIGDNAGCVSRA